MISVKFPESNLPLAKDQPEYETLYVLYQPKEEGQPMTACFQLSQDELNQVVNSGGEIWITQYTFGNNFQPIRMSTSKPF